MRRCAHIAVALSLVACNTVPKPAPMPNKVSVGVPTTCVPASLGPAPIYPYPAAALLAETKGPRLFVEIFEDFRLMAQRLAEAEPVIAGCRRTP